MDGQPTTNKTVLDWGALIKVLLTLLASSVLFLGTYLAAAIIGSLLGGFVSPNSGQRPPAAGPPENEIIGWLALLAIPVLFPMGWMWLFSAFNAPASQVGLNMPASSWGCFLGLALALIAIPAYFGL